MYAASRRAEVLFRLGFPHKAPTPGDAYALEEEQWIIGGEIAPNQNPIIPAQVIKKGTWLPSKPDLWVWLGTYTDIVVMKHKPNESKQFSITAKIKNRIYEEQNYLASWLALAKLTNNLLILFKQKRARQFPHPPAKMIYTIPLESWTRELSYVSKTQMIHLESLGFKIDNVYYASAGDCYLYEDKTFFLGGPLLFDQTKPKLLCPPEIYERGMQIASSDELEEWLSNRVSYEIIKEKGKSYRGRLCMEQGNFWVDGNSLVETFYHLIVELLEVNPAIEAYDQP